jgi:hypothetical protein
VFPESSQRQTSAYRTFARPQPEGELGGNPRCCDPRHVTLNMLSTHFGCRAQRASCAASTCARARAATARVAPLSFLALSPRSFVPALAPFLIFPASLRQHHHQHQHQTQHQTSLGTNCRSLAQLLSSNLAMVLRSRGGSVCRIPPGIVVAVVLRY